MRTGIAIALAAGLVAGGAALSTSASAGVLSAASRLQAPTHNVVHVAWFKQFNVDQSMWHSLDREQRHAFKQQWREAKHAARQGDTTLLASLQSSLQGAFSSTGGSGASSNNSVSALVGSTTPPANMVVSTNLVQQGPSSQSMGNLVNGYFNSNYLALRSYGIDPTKGPITLNLQSWLEHSTNPVTSDAGKFLPVPQGAHIVNAFGTSNVKSIGVTGNNTIKFSLLDPTKDGSFNYLIALGNGKTQLVTGNQIYANQQKIVGGNFTNTTTSNSVTIPFSEVFANVSDPNNPPGTLKIAGIPLTKGVSSVVLDDVNHVIHATLQGNVQKAKLRIVVTDGKTFNDLTKTIIRYVASPNA